MTSLIGKHITLENLTEIHREPLKRLAAEEQIGLMCQNLEMAINLIAGLTLL